MIFRRLGRYGEENTSFYAVSGEKTTYKDDIVGEMFLRQCENISLVGQTREIIFKKYIVNITIQIQVYLRCRELRELRYELRYECSCDKSQNIYPSNKVVKYVKKPQEDILGVSRKVEEKGVVKYVTKVLDKSQNIFSSNKQ